VAPLKASGLSPSSARTGCEIAGDTRLEAAGLDSRGVREVSGLFERFRLTKLRVVVKRMVQGIAVILALPPGLLCWFGRIRILYTFFAQMIALAPGILGDFYRAAFYKLTLEDCSIDVVIGFGSFFSRRRVSIAANVSIGSYCIIGEAKIGSRTQISSHVEIPGARQHLRDERGRLSDSSEAPNTYVTIGADCWIGAGSIVMADVGAESTIGAGSVVVKPIPPRVVAVGVPAKSLKNSWKATGEEAAE
jgi:virginiamycin A acetyltransferase